jgi:hypothetical protein
MNYHVYSNGGSGPIDYAAPIATVAGLSWASGPLAAPGDWKFGVRAFDPATGLEEQNLDCAVRIVLDTMGKDVTDRPLPPVGLRAFPLSGGAARVEWSYPPTRGAKAPAGFHVYIGTGGTPGYSAPIATVAYSSGLLNSFVANLSGLSGGTAYSAGVRAYNASGEEANTTAVSFTAATAGPSPVGSLTAAAIV